MNTIRSNLQAFVALLLAADLITLSVIHIPHFFSLLSLSKLILGSSFTRRQMNRGSTGAATIVGFNKKAMDSCVGVDLVASVLR
jgi:hypothetical protein